ncbi:MAG: hypothetical protein EB059_07700 [Alphaproteobacteria bacterium]|nr:hypothetical protein [Alphaproteobacteria bacterium]
MKKHITVFCATLFSLSVLLSGGIALAQTANAQTANSVQTTVKALPLPEQPAPVAQTEAKPKINDLANPAKKIYVAPELSDRPNPATNVILPPLYGWSRVVMKDLKMPEEKLINECSMKKDMIFHFFVERLREGAIPLVNEMQADSLVSDGVTVEAEPQIITMQDSVINCISWIQYKVTVHYTFRVPPLMYRRKVPILLWSDGMMVSSAKSTHNGALISGFIDLAMRFRNAWDKQNASVDQEMLK